MGQAMKTPWPPRAKASSKVERPEAALPIPLLSLAKVDLNVVQLVPSFKRSPVVIQQREKRQAR
jgi:hypothetical protein